MGYLIVKSITIKEDKVLIHSASNNVFPRNYIKEISPYFTDILKNKGRKEVEKEILYSYWQGLMQDTDNDYEIVAVSYRNNKRDWDEENKLLVKSELYDEYIKYRNSKKEKMVIVNVERPDHYVEKKSKWNIYFTNRIGKAKTFSSSLRASHYLNGYSRDKYRIEPLKTIVTIQ